MSFIVIEGLDGSGKSTQVKKLCDYFVQKGLSFEFIHFPDTGEEYFGKLISRFLRGEFGSIDEVDAWVVAMFFAGNRWALSSTIKQWLEKNKLVLVDRYVFSNMAYQVAKVLDEDKKQELRQWIYSLEFNKFNIPKPDLSIWLDVPVSFVERQLNSTRLGDDRSYLNGVKDIHEDSIHFQKLVYDEYALCYQQFVELKKVICYDEAGEMLNESVIFERLISVIKESLQINI